MLDPYKELGLDHSASNNDVRRAFRIKSKAAHPDQGGDKTAFERLKACEQLLLDPERRALFDDEGITDLDGKLDLEVLKVIERHLSMLFNAHFNPQNPNKEASDPRNLDLITVLIEGINVDLRRVDNDMAIKREASAMFEHVNAKLSGGNPKKGKVLENLFIASVAVQQTAIEKLERERASMIMAQRLLLTYEYEYEPSEATDTIVAALQASPVAFKFIQGG